MLDSLHDDRCESLTSVEIGGDEGGVSFGDGVFPPEEFGGETWHWFGGSGGTAIVQVADDVAANVTDLRLDGSPIESGISVRAVVDGDTAETVGMGADDRHVITVPLP